uniref:Secreted protein n=1 Tax=Trichogramma kaykai TaxID=54128 RepID=A0ABD2VTI4_9HYME
MTRTMFGKYVLLLVLVLLAVANGQEQQTLQTRPKLNIIRSGIKFRYFVSVAAEWLKSLALRHCPTEEWDIRAFVECGKNIMVALKPKICGNTLGAGLMSGLVGGTNSQQSPIGKKK